MVRAGISLKDSLDLISKQVQNEKFAKAKAWAIHLVDQEVARLEEKAKEDFKKEFPGIYEFFKKMNL